MSGTSSRRSGSRSWRNRMRWFWAIATPGTPARRPRTSAGRPIVDRLRKDGWPKDPAIEHLDDSSTRVVSLLNHPEGALVLYPWSGRRLRAVRQDHQLHLGHGEGRGPWLQAVHRAGRHPQRAAPPDPGPAGAAAGGAEPIDVVTADRTGQGLHAAGEPGLLLRQEQQDARAVRGEEERDGAAQARPLVGEGIRLP